MGYQARIYSLKWAEGHHLHGLEASLTGLSIGRLRKVRSAIRTVASDDAPDDEKEAAEGVLFGEVAKSLLSWNLDDIHGQPVPTTAEAVAEQDTDLIVQLVTDWIEATASVDTPLPASSNGGPKPMPETSIPMAPLSPSPAN